MVRQTQSSCFILTSELSSVGMVAHNVFSIAAYIPAPIYFGVAIDQACALWDGGSEECMGSYGSCMVSY